MCGVSICLLHNEVEPGAHQYVLESSHKPSSSGMLSSTPSTLQNTDPTIKDLSIDEYQAGTKSEFGRIAANNPKREHAHQCSLLEESKFGDFYQDISPHNIPILPVFLNMFVKLCLGVVKDVCSWMYGCC